MTRQGDHGRRSQWLRLDHYPNDPERSLLAAVVVHAARDLRRGRAEQRDDARRYFDGRNFDDDAAALGLDAKRFRQMLTEELSAAG